MARRLALLAELLIFLVVAHSKLLPDFLDTHATLAAFAGLPGVDQKAIIRATIHRLRAHLVSIMRL